MSKEGNGGRGSGGGKGLKRISLDGGSGFDAIPEDRHAPELAFRSVNPMGSRKYGVDEEQVALVKQPATHMEQRYDTSYVVLSWLLVAIEDTVCVCVF